MLVVDRVGAVVGGGGARVGGRMLMVLPGVDGGDRGCLISTVCYITLLLYNRLSHRGRRLRQVETPTFSWVINSPGMERGLHYVTIFMLSAVSDPDREPTVMEPDKCEGEKTTPATTEWAHFEKCFFLFLFFIFTAEGGLLKTFSKLPATGDHS